MNDTEEIALYGAGAVAATGVSVVGIYAWSTGWFRLAEPPRTLITGRPLTNREQLERYSRYTGVPRGAGEWRAIPSSGLPQGARKIPIVSPRFTPMCSAQTSRAVSLENHFLLALNTWRDLLRNAGRGDEDPRVTLYRFWEESGAGRFCWNYNDKNSKITPYATRDSILGTNEAPHVWTTNPRVSGIFLLIDRGRSFDSYPAFNNWNDALADGKDFWVRNQRAIPAYRGVHPGQVRGGLEGLIACERAMHEGGYSSGVWLAKERACRSFWARAIRKCGESNWVR